jgi:hypothetical protein
MFLEMRAEHPRSRFPYDSAQRPRRGFRLPSVPILEDVGAFQPSRIVNCEALSVEKSPVLVVVCGAEAFGLVCPRTARIAIGVQCLHCGFGLSRRSFHHVCGLEVSRLRRVLARCDMLFHYCWCEAVSVLVAHRLRYTIQSCWKTAAKGERNEEVSGRLV